jgi:hypothetical protein
MVRNILYACLMCVLLLASGTTDAGYKVKPFSASHAKVFAAHDSHDNITIAAEPYDQPERILQVFDRDPSKANYVTVLIVVSNDGNDEIELDANDIQLTRPPSGAAKSTPADDVVRDLFYPRDRRRSSGGRVGIGFGIKGNPERDYMDARADFLSKEFGHRFVAPHSTAYGFVFYETPQLGAALIGAKIYVPQVLVRRSTNPKQAGRELMFYEVDLKNAIVGHR